MQKLPTIKHSIETLQPKYLCCIHSGGDKNILALEDKRRELLLREFFYQLNLRSKVCKSGFTQLNRTQLPACIRFSGLVTPVHSPLIKFGKKLTSYKKQYRGISWIDMSLLEQSWDLLRLIDSEISPNQWPIFLFTYADLLESTEPLLQLIR